MGALMVIFSLQPKQRAKTKGRRPSFPTFIFYLLLTTVAILHRQAEIALEFASVP